MDDSQLVKIEMEHLAGEMTIELKIEVPPAKLIGHVKGFSITWQADGVRITIPGTALDVVLEKLTGLAGELDKAREGTRRPRRKT